MLWNAKSHVLHANGDETEYITFGTGEKTLVIIPGLGDALQTVKGHAIPYAYLYQAFAKEYTVYTFSRKDNLPKNYSTRQMARDIFVSLNKLGIKSAKVIGISMGGMIAQYLAIDYPQMVEKLALVVTLSRQNDTVQSVLSGWLELALEDNYHDLIMDTALKSYTEDFLNRHKAALMMATKIGKPHSFQRYETLANACLLHDAYEELEEIQCPTIVIGGELDQIVSPGASLEIAKKIPGCQLYMYPQYGHALYEEAEDFTARIDAFFDHSPNHEVFMREKQA